MRQSSSELSVCYEKHGKNLWFSKLRLEVFAVLAGVVFFPHFHAVFDVVTNTTEGEEKTRVKKIFFKIVRADSMRKSESNF